MRVGLGLTLGAASLVACSVLADLDGFSDGSCGPECASDSGTPSDPDATRPLVPDGNDAASDAGVAGEPLSAAILRDRPIAYFRFEESSGDVCKNEISDSPLICSLSSGSPGGLRLRATGSGGSRVGVGLASADAAVVISGTFPAVGLRAFAVEAVLQVSDVSKKVQIAQRMVFAGGTGPPETGDLFFLNDTGRFRTEGWRGGAHLFYTLAAAPAAPAKWYHLAYGYSPALGHDYLYVDGVPQDGSLLGGDAGSGRATIDLPQVWGNWTGTLDELAFYDRELTAAQIATHRAAQ